MSDEEKCSWCGVTQVYKNDKFIEFACGSFRERNGSTWTRGDECTSPPPPIPPAPPRPPQPVSDRQELIRRFAVAIADGLARDAKMTAQETVEHIWRVAEKLADAEPRVDGTEGTA